MNSVKQAPDYLLDEHLSPGTKAYLKVLNGGVPVESLSVEEARRVLADVQAAVHVDLSDVEESERTIESEGRRLRLHLVRPVGTGHERLPAFVFVHGGGWVLGDYPTHRRLVRDLVAESGCAAVFVDYTLSPEAHFPQAVEEVYAAVKWVAGNGREIGVDGSRLALAGNSAGGNMSLAAALVAKDHGGPQMRTLVLMWPVTDAGYDWESYVEYGRQRFLTAPLMKWMFDRYVYDPAQHGSDLMSPVRASAERLRGLPPTLIAVAENDILRDEGEAMGRRLDEAGVEVTTVRFNGVIHDWGMLNGFAGLHPTRTLVRLAGAVLRDALAKP
ncbi:alpha/beta hydrolase [uncultured Alistipes sp.]|uniref:alpha/beta hydrolase n=3 Tax=uncultured Alistipes sp. TaxID=538949 RepID=UPI0025D74AC4|nr:alpha/beta hydrolase [uncultured Alistipes sp.]